MASYVWTEEETEIFLNIKKEKKNPSSFSVWKQQRNPDPQGERGFSIRYSQKELCNGEKKSLQNWWQEEEETVQELWK